MAEHPEERAIQRESERFLFAAFEIGVDAEKFLKTDTGRYMQGLAEQEIAEACRVFLNHNTRRSIDKVADAQVKAMQARQAFHWMLEAITQGHAAEYQLRELDDMERS